MPRRRVLRQQIRYGQHPEPAEWGEPTFGRILGNRRSTWIGVLLGLLAVTLGYVLSSRKQLKAANHRNYAIWYSGVLITRCIVMRSASSM